MNKVHQIITDRIIEQLEQGVIPWKRPWGGPEYEPKNLISKKTYSGVNFFLLSMLNHNNPHYVTYKQAKQCGGNVKKGEKGFPVIFFKINPAEKNLAGDVTKDGYAMMRYYTVFNIDQCEEINPDKIPVMAEGDKLDFNPIEEAELIAAGYKDGPPIIEAQNKAYYSVDKDLINMPLKENFTGNEEYYSVLFHEMTHSTRHKKRLNREKPSVALEELVAEMGAAFLCSRSGIDNTLENSASYIDNWLRDFKKTENANLIVQAGSKAQKAVNYICGVTK